MPANRKGLIMLEEVEKKKKKRAMWLEEREAAGKEYGGVSRRHFTEPSRFGMKLGT